MDILKKFSLNSLVERFGQSFMRFPIAMLLTLFLACFLIYANHGGEVGMKREFFLMFYPSTAALLAVALSLLTEDFKSKFVAVAVQAVVHAAWLAVSYYLAQFEHFSLPQLIAVSATVATIGLAVFLICFYRRNHDLPFWNFSIRTISALIVAYAISGILYLGLVLLVESLKMLFGIHINDNVYTDIAIVCMVLLAPALFMNLVPKREEKYTYDVLEFSHFSKGVVQYLFLPLLGVYMITLYAYAAKILLQWSLPVGGVSYLVTGSMVLMVLLIYFTYPLLHMEGNKFFKSVTRWIPVLMLPLLALMTVAIYRRLSDYGITVSRLYLLVFNLWCYAVCLWLICTRNKRIWMIPASFAVILFLISVGPQSIPNITERHLLNEARAAFMASGLKSLPLSDEQYKRWADEADPDVAASIDSKLHYLTTYYSPESIYSVVKSAAFVGSYSHHLAPEEDVYIDKVISYGNSHMITNMTMPQGYSRMTLLREMSEGAEIDEDKILLVLNDGEHSEEYRFFIDVEMFKKFDEEGTYQPGETLAVKNDRALLVFDYFRLWGVAGQHDYAGWDFEGKGILFTK